MTGAFLHPFTAPAAEGFTSIVRGSGALVYDADGRSYLDAMGSLWYCAIGHGRREMAEAIGEQIATLEAYSCFGQFTNPPADELAERVATLSPVPDPRVFLCQSGSEAVDTAIKLARLVHARNGEPERTLVISREGGYHGTNYGGTSAQGLPANKEGWGPLVPDVVQVGRHDVEGLARLLAERGRQVAAVLAEPVQGAAGVHPPDAGYLESLRRLCDRHGALLIFDEVITAFGRLGAWFAAERFEVTPDLTTFAKAVTSGYQPLGGVILSGAASAALERDPDFVLRTGYTYSGHATACRAALTNLDIIEREGLLKAADRIERRLGDGLAALAADGLIERARGIGAMWAGVVRDDQDAETIRRHMLQRGVIVRAIGDRAITFCPPLVIDDEQIDQAVDALADAAAGT